MSSRKRKRLSVWGVLARLGLPLRGGCGGDRDAIIEHVFDTASRLTFRSQDGEPIGGDDFLVSVFESLGTTKNWPGCGTPEWETLRFQALTKVVERLGREGLYDCISVGADGTPALTGNETDGEQGGGGSDATETPDGDGGRKSPTAEDEGLTLHNGDQSQTAKDKNPDPRTGVQVGRALIRRCQRNPDGWLRCVDRVTPYRVLVQWAKETCPGASAESLAALMDGLRLVRWWEDDGHILGGEILHSLEAELERGCENEQWMLVESDFEDAIRRLRSVFEKLSLL